MPLLIYGAPIVVGFVLGYFLAWPILIAITAAAIAFSAYALHKTKDAEMGAFLGIIVAIVCGIGLIAMWVTFIASSGLAIPGEFFQGWLLRQH